MKHALIGVALGAVAGLGATTASADEIVARFSTHWGPAHPASQQANAFIDRVNERLAGKFRIESFPSGQLYGIREIFGALASGSVDMGAVVGIVSFPPVEKNYNVTAFPGYFESFAQQRDFFENDPVGREIWQNILDKSRAMVIGYNPVGPTATYSSSSTLDSVEAMKGVKARVLVKSDRPWWDAMGVGKMVSLPTREVYTSLQNGTIDTIRTVPGALKAYSWTEHLKFGQLPWSTFADAYVMANRSWFEGLPDDVKTVLMEEGQRLTEVSTADIMRASEQANADFVAGGGKIVTLSGAELTELRKIEAERVEPALADFVDAEVLDAVKKHVGR
jgi:TRAP-type C4-dicarboxylate transport system substrate-binding protein